MKKLLIFLGFFLVSVAVEAQSVIEGYHPFVKEGKAWNYKEYEYEMLLDEGASSPEEEVYYRGAIKEIRDFCLVFSGDTIVGGHNCKKLYRKDISVEHSVSSYVSAWYEEGRKVYCIEKGSVTPKVLYDFSASLGEKLNVFTGVSVFFSNEDLVEVNGKTFLRQYIGTEHEDITYNEYMLKCVSGVGTFMGVEYGCGEFATLVCPYGKDDNITTEFISCEEDGEVIFTKDDFNKEAYVEPEPIAGYRPMLKEGKTWNEIVTEYRKVDLGDGIEATEEVEYPVRYVLEGDTVINGQKCMKMYKYCQDERTHHSSWYEDNYKVYCFYADESVKHLIFDFGMTIGEVANFDTEYSLSLRSVDLINVNGRIYCRQHFSLTLEENDVNVCVSGVGSKRDGIHYGGLSFQPTYYFATSRFVSCEEDGEVIFTSKDFNRAPVAEAAESIDLYGFITDTDGKGIADATISFQREGDEEPWGLPVSTDADGFYRISVPNMSAVYTVSITAKGYDVFTETGLEVEENDSRYFNFTLSVVNGIDAVHSSEPLNSLSFGGSRGGAPVYDLQGRKVADNSTLSTLNSQLKPGIYIKDGRKFMAK